jgi:hypothetical protein
MKKIKEAMIAKQEYIYIYIKDKTMLNDNIRKETIIAILKKLNSTKKKKKLKKTTKTFCFKKQNNVE